MTPALLAAAALAACKDAAGPDTVDTGALTAKLGAVTTTFQSNIAYRSLTELAGRFPQFGGTALLRRMAPSPHSLPAPFGPATLAQRGPQPGPSDLQALFPADALGKTYEWNVATDTYEATARTGAPGTGIRIILYTVDPFSQPAEPLAELGYVDLTDESTASADQLGVLLRLASTTIADYSITVATATGWERSTAAGYITQTSGSGRVDFDLMQYFDYTTYGGDWESTLTPEAGGQVVIESHSTSSGAPIQTLISVSDGPGTVAISATDAFGSVTGQVSFNGTVVASLAFPVGGPLTIMDANGRQLTEQEREDVTWIYAHAWADLVVVSLVRAFRPGFVVF